MSLSVLLVDSTNAAKYKTIATSPGPIFVVDLEGGASKIPGEKVYWNAADIKAGKFPKVTDSTTVVTTVETVDQFTEATSAVFAPDSPFRSIWIDSATVLTQIGEIEIARKNKDGRQGYGDMLREFRPILMALKASTARPDRKLEVFGSTAWVQAGRQAPAMQGQLVDWYNNMCDVVGYMSMEIIDNKLAYRMRIWPAPNGADPKSRGTTELYVKYNESILNPNISNLSKEIIA